MANLLRNRISIDAAEDNSFIDSPSFTDLVCIQDQKSNSLSANNSTSQDDMSISSTQLQLQELLCQSKQSETEKRPCYEPNKKVRNQAKKKHTATSSFGRKLFELVVSPCRECHAHQPTTKDDTMQHK